MNTTLPLLAITMGLLSSFHCLGMCGPIALAIPLGSSSKLGRFVAVLVYNIGRATTYSILGFIFGTIATTIYWLGYLKYLSIGAGILMLAYVLFASKIEQQISKSTHLNTFLHGLKARMGTQLIQKNNFARFSLGLLNGLLPCGMVYLALVSSMATGGNLQSALFMFIYGLGTFPMMIGVGYFKEFITPAIRSKMRRLLPFILSFLGMLLILRGVYVNYGPKDAPHPLPICASPAALLEEK